MKDCKKAWQVKNGKKVRFGFSLSEEKEREIEQKNLEVCMVVFLSIPGHHEKITVSFWTSFASFFIKFEF